jgi:hypothetical protein
MTLVLNYNKVASLPAFVRGFCYNNDAWVVGSGACYLLDLQGELPRDWDLLIPFWTWGIACKSIPHNSPTNSQGGIKVTLGDLCVDVWAGDIGWFLGQVPVYPAYAVHPRSMIFLVAARDQKRIK